MSIKDYILQNFKDCTIDEIKSSIEDSLASNDEVTLPGLGVFFQILWSHSSIEERQNILNIINKNI